MDRVTAQFSRWLRSSQLVLASALLLSLLTSAGRAQYINGVDVYNGDGAVNWTNVKNAGNSFAFVKATEGVDFIDARFNSHMATASAAGIYVGPYHFCRVDSKNGVPFTTYDGQPFTPGSAPYEDAVSEAQDFLDAILPHYRTRQHLPPVADVEGLPNFGSASLERTFISHWTQLFSDTVYAAMGVRPLIYTSKSGATTDYTAAVAGSHDLWLAWWRGTGTTQPPQQSDTPLWDPWLFWQWTATGTVNGITGNVDRNVFRGTAQELENLLVGFDGLAGDFNDDNVVDAADYVVWQKTMNSTVPLYSGADGNGNARIDADDLNVWRKNFGRVGSGSGGSTGSELPAGVPEPGTAGLVGMALGLMTAGFGRSFSCR